MTILLTAALLPPLFLLIQIYRMDKVEKEPKRLIVKLLFFGILTTIPAALLESVAEGILPEILTPKTVIYILVDNFLCVALVEELVKYVALKRVSWNHPAFNYTFDGIVYAVSVSIGFAAAENILYVQDGGLATAVIRAVTSIPGHCIFAIYMGIAYSLAKYYETRGDLKLRQKYLNRAILIPMMLHGFYDFCASMDSGTWTAVFFAFVIVLDVVAYRKVQEMEREDRPL